MTDECVHYWELPPPDGTESLGKCKSCGEEKTFYNWDEARDGSPWRRQQKATWKGRKSHDVASTS